MILTPNITTKCQIVCPFLTELNHDLDTGVYYCSYEEWAYAIAALICTVASILPCGLILSCLAKRRKRRQKRLFPQLSRQISATSTEVGSKFGPSDSEYETFHSPITERSPFAHTGVYGTFASLPDTFGPTTTCAPHRHGLRQHYLSHGDVRPQGATIETYSGCGLPFDFSHFDDKPEVLHRTSVTSEPPRKHSRIGNIYPDISRSCNSFQGAISEGGYVTDAVNDTTESFESFPKPVKENNPDTSNTTVESRETNTVEGSQQPTSVVAVPSTVSSSSSVRNDTDDEDSMQGSSPYMYSLPTRKDFEDYILNCVSKKPEDERNGTFLIRESLSHPENKVLMLYCKSVEVPRNVFYFKLCKTVNGRIYVEGPTNDSFESLDALIMYHRNYRSFFPCFLADCLGVNFAFRASLHAARMEIGRQSVESL